jgi:hypothetical protein
MDIQDFDFKFTGYGHYQVTYTSPRSGNKWRVTTTDMELIDATKNSDTPKKKDLLTLKRLCKG